MENKLASTKKILFILPFFIIFIFFYGSANGSQQKIAKHSTSLQKTQSKSTDINSALEEFEDNIRGLKANDERTAENIRGFKATADAISSALEQLKNDISSLSESKRSFENFASYGDPIGMTAILVGVMTLVLTALAAITGIGFYKSHRAFEQQKEILIERARVDVNSEIKSYLENFVKPELQKRINELDTKFWQRTYMGRQLENEYWLKLLSTEKDIQMRLDRNNKFNLAIAKVFSEEDIEGGLGFFYHHKTEHLPASFEKCLYKLYSQGIFNQNIPVFSNLIKQKFHLELKPWLEKIQKDIEASQNGSEC